MRPAQHGHELDLGVVTGAGWLLPLLVAGALAVAAAGMLRPFLPRPGRRERLAVTGVAGAVAVLVLLGGPLAAPRQAAVGALLLAALPVAAARRAEPPRPARRAAPALAGLAGVLAAAPALPAVVLLAAAVLAPSPAVPPAGAEALARTALLAGVVGLSWLALHRPASRRSRVGAGALGWLLGHAVLAGVGVLVLTGAA